MELLEGRPIEEAFLDGLVSDNKTYLNELMGFLHPHSEEQVSE